MRLTDLPRGVASRALRVARLPADLVLDRAPENRITTLLRGALDRVDGAIRGSDDAHPVAEPTAEERRGADEREAGERERERRRQAEELREAVKPEAQRRAEGHEDEAADEADDRDDARQLKEAMERVQEERRRTARAG